LEIGVARRDITCWKPGLGMMGWGQLDNYATSVATPLSARAFVLRDPSTGDKLAMVCCEIAFISLALRDAVVRRLTNEPARGFGLDNVMLMATHTHSGPGGFTHYAFYNVTIPGFAQDVLDGIADGIVAAIRAADDGRVPGDARYDSAEIPPDDPVAFNRSIASYNRNPDVAPVVAGEEHLALDRTLRLLRFDTATGDMLGAINWFAVHCTSVHSDNHALHFDNKGYAAQLMEAELAAVAGHEVVAAFGQGASGDVTPNRRRHPGRPFVRGELEDDDASARYNGGLQARCALAAHASAKATQPLSPRIRCAHAFVDMSAVDVDPRFVDGRTGLRTSPAEIGMAMFFGTDEGPGLPRIGVGLQKWFVRARSLSRSRSRRDAARDASQCEKVAWVEPTKWRVLGLSALDRIPALPLPRRAREAVRMFRALASDRAADNPWTPQVLPIQLAIVGDVALVAVPHELTTVAGRRLTATVASATADLGVRRAVLVGYANAYAGYVTTPEEYELQDYEGASTHFGKWTLPAYQTVFAQLAASLGGATRPAWRASPPVFAAQDLAARAFAG
jgi:neutral ceramidase